MGPHPVDLHAESGCELTQLKVIPITDIVNNTIDMQIQTEFRLDWQTFTSSWGFNYAFLASIIIALLLAYWTYSPREKWRLSYHIESSTIVDRTDGDFSDDLTVLYKTVPIPRATLARVYFWNSGNKTLRRTDIAPKSPLTLTVSGDQRILQASIRSMALPAVDAEIMSEDESAYSATFEFLEPTQGFLVELLHTGDTGDLVVDGILISAKEPVNELLPSKSVSVRSILSAVALGIGFPLTALHAATTYFKPTADNPLFTGMSFAAAFIISCLWMFALLYYVTNRGSKKANFGPIDTAP